MFNLTIIGVQIKIKEKQVRINYVTANVGQTDKETLER